MKIVIKNRKPVNAKLILNDSVKYGKRGAARRYMAEFKPRLEEYVNQVLEAAEREHGLGFYDPLEMYVNFFWPGDPPVVHMTGRALDYDTGNTVFVELFMNKGGSGATCWKYAKVK